MSRTQIAIATDAVLPREHRRMARTLLVISLSLAGLLPAAYAQTATPRSPAAAAAHPSKAFWLDIKGTPAAQSQRGRESALRLNRFRTLTLDSASMAGLMAGVPMERSQAARQTPLVVSLPDPDGGFQRFTVVEAPVMEAGLAAKHPHIKTYAGRGIDDPTASLRMSITQLGLQASVRSQQGSWYIDPYYQLDDSLYVSYYKRDAVNLRPAFAEAMMFQPQLSMDRGRYHAGNRVEVRGAGFSAGAQVTITVRHVDRDAAPRQTISAVASADGTISASFAADPYRDLGSYSVTAADGRATATAVYQVVGDGGSLNAAVGSQLRTYRLALLTDPSYATYFGAANVTAGKVALMTRVTQIYEDETAIRMVLIANNDWLNLNTVADMTGTNGPCGGAACYSASQASGCGSSTLTRNRQVLGLLVGASSFDVGHIAFGLNGGGIASLGVVGGNGKAQGCTGVPSPVGDAFAVDYVAHELGHQFAGNHTFNGVVGNCSGGNRSAGNSVEPGSGTSIMAYAGICGTDNTQPNSDPYWSQRSFDEVVTYTSAAESIINEVQLAALTGLNTDGMQFQLRYAGSNSATIVRGTNFTTAGVKVAIEGIPGWPAGGTVTVGALSDTGFTVNFGGTLTGVNTGLLEVVNITGGAAGFIGEIAVGGPGTRRGTVTATGNMPPTVTVPGTLTIPVRTPFALTGSATDADGDALTYMWEQNDRGAGTGTGLVSNTKLDGPLFRQFGTRATAVVNPLTYAPPGQNATTTNPTRVFPDMPQILANDTNAETGACPLAVPTTPSPAEIDCYSEFLPTAAYVGATGVNASPASLNFRLTARDGRGGVNSANTQLVLAPGAGPFLVTSPNTAVTLDGTSTQTVTWDVANTNVAPVGTANVKITLSANGGATWPYTLAASAANNGSQSVVMPNVGTTQARVRVEAVGNVFFDVSNANFTIRLTGDANADGVINCADIKLVRVALGKRTGQPGFDPRADFNNDGVIDIRDLAYVSQRFITGNRC